SGAVLLAPGLRFREPGRDIRKMMQRVDNYYIFGSFRIRVDALEDMGKYNAIELADKISIPTLIIHAKDDQVVPYTQSTEFFEKLKIQDKKLILLDEGGHVFSTYTSKTRVITEIVNWIKERSK
ncbi:MAG: alpha/beta hydrolase, partial [Desulfurococcaceae archaeon]|nr:alpha/beta hydrolase [Desulfurococcaceae archaeon]